VVILQTPLKRAILWVAPLSVALAVNGAAFGATSNVDRYYSKTYSDCMASAGGATYPTRDCQSAEVDAWDGRLNGVYKQLLGKADAAGKVKLRDEERAWLKRVTHKCDHAGDDEAGGSLQPIEIADCYLTEKILRTVELRKRL
jgi:uncharacterized protein YecT (DUF1311 family)